ncbi:MAG: hypothetical protein ACJAVF_000750 [Paraglaciecola sp.]
MVKSTLIGLDFTTNYYSNGKKHYYKSDKI